MQKCIENKPKNIWPNLTAAVPKLFRNNYFSWLIPPFHAAPPISILPFIPITPIVMDLLSIVLVHTKRLPLCFVYYDIPKAPLNHLP